MSDQLDFTPQRVLTPAAMPGAGYRVQFFQSGTTTPVTVYTTSGLDTAHPSPLIADAAGVFPQVFSAGGAIKAVLTKPDGSAFYTVDPSLRVSVSGSGASDVSFSPTVELPFENVQEAIEGAAATAASGFTPFGLGVTGTNELIADLDATGTASGAYRFNDSTTGTFPTGVAAADTGTVQIWRENAGDAVMWLQSGAADRQFTRRLASSSWGAWREVITINQPLAEGDIFYRGASSVVRLAKGTAGQILSMNSAATAPEWFSAPSWTWLAEQSTTSETTKNFTGIPAAAQEVIVLFKDVGLDSSGNIGVRIGDTGGISATGYSSDGSYGGSTTDSTTSFIMRIAGTSRSALGTMHLWHVGGNEWIASHSIGYSHGGGTKTLANALDRVRVFADGGNFDEGAVQVGYR